MFRLHNYMQEAEHRIVTWSISEMAQSIHFPAIMHAHVVVRHGQSSLVGNVFIGISSLWFWK